MKSLEIDDSRHTTTPRFSRLTPHAPDDRGVPLSRGQGQVEREG